MKSKLNVRVLGVVLAIAFIGCGKRGSELSANSESTSTSSSNSVLSDSTSLKSLDGRSICFTKTINLPAPLFDVVKPYANSLSAMEVNGIQKLYQFDYAKDQFNPTIDDVLNMSISISQYDYNVLFNKARVSALFTFNRTQAPGWTGGNRINPRCDTFRVVTPWNYPLNIVVLETFYGEVSVSRSLGNGEPTVADLKAAMNGIEIK